MSKLRKIIHKLVVFEPQEDGTYSVFPESREFSYQGAKQGILEKMTKKLPILKNPMAYLLDKEAFFFHDPYTNQFYVFASNCEKKERERGITIHTQNIDLAIQVKAKKGVDFFLTNKYISKEGFGPYNFMDRETSFEFEPDPILEEEVETSDVETSIAEVAV